MTRPIYFLPKGFFVGDFGQTGCPESVSDGPQSAELVSRSFAPGVTAGSFFGAA